MTINIPALADLSRMDVAQLDAAQDAIRARLHDLHIDERGEVRELAGDERTEFDQLMNLDSRVDAHRKIRDQYNRGSGYEVAFGHHHRGRSERQVDELRGRALRVLDQRGRHLPAAAGDRVDELVRTQLGEHNRHFDGARLAERIVLTENDDYQAAFAQVLAAGLRGRAPILSAEEARALRDFEAFEARAPMAVGSGATGGVGLPVFIDPSIILTAQQDGEYDQILQISRVVQVNTGSWKGVASAGVVWSFDAEAEEVSDDSPDDLSQPTVDVHTARGFVPHSLEVGQDYPMFAEEMAGLLREGFLDLAGEKVSVGSGNGEPEGIVTALDADTNVEVLLTTAGTLGAVDVYAVWEQLPKRARRRARWMTSTTVQNKVRQLGANANGSQDPNFTVDMTADAIQRLFGRTYHLNDQMDGLTTTGHQNAVVVGDFSRFLVAVRAGMTIEAVPHLFGLTTNRPTGQRGFFAWGRIGSGATDTTAFRLLNQT